MAYKAFVSSTFLDLQKHRQYVIAALRKAGFFVDPMEDWTAASSEPKDFSQKRLEGCDLCVLLVAFRRGFIPDGETRSITQMEYQTARNQSIDILAFLLLEDAPWPRKYDEMEKDPEIQLWRKELKHRHGVDFFGLNPDSIDIAAALTRWLAEKQQREPARYEDDAPLELQPELRTMVRECREGGNVRAMRDLRERITQRLQALAEKSGRDETGQPPMETLRRLAVAGEVEGEALQSFEYALAVTGESLYDQDVEAAEALRAIRAAAIGFNALAAADEKSPQFRFKKDGHGKWSFFLFANGEELLAGMPYATLPAAKSGLQSLRRAVESRRICDGRAPSGNFIFDVIGLNGERLGRSIACKNRIAMERIIQTVIQFAPKAPVVILP